MLIDGQSAESVPPEPYRIKTIEPIRLPSAPERKKRMLEAGYNVFLLRSDDVFLDLLTDSGTSAMSAQQWAAMMVGDEAYAHARSYYRLRDSIRDILGFEHFLPCHQGRAAERIFFPTLLRPGDIVVSNTLFDTTRANVEAAGGVGIDLPTRAADDAESDDPFKGNLDLDSLEKILAGPDGSRVRLLHITVTNNAGGGRAVSLQNLQAARKLADRHKIPLWIDGCRFAENAFLIKQADPAHADKPVARIVHEMFDLADGTIVSAKKDGLANIGGFLAYRNEDALSERMRQKLILGEGFPTYGGLAGRDLEAIAQGLREVIDESYLAHRIGQVRFLATLLRQAGVPILWPPGGHAVYVDAGRLLAHLPADHFPAQALACELYLEAGIRGVEIGSLMFGAAPTNGRRRPELLRLAIPRRVYTETHLRYVANAVAAIAKRASTVEGLRLVSNPDQPLRHFTARLEPVSRREIRTVQPAR